jgi:hypothetical protein
MAFRQPSTGALRRHKRGELIALEQGMHMSMHGTAGVYAAALGHRWHKNALHVPRSRCSIRWCLRTIGSGAAADAAGDSLEGGVPGCDPRSRSSGLSSGSNSKPCPHHRDDSPHSARSKRNSFCVRRPQLRALLCTLRMPHLALAFDEKGVQVCAVIPHAVHTNSNSCNQSARWGCGWMSGHFPRLSRVVHSIDGQARSGADVAARPRRSIPAARIQ